MTVLLPEADRFKEIRGLLSDTWLTSARSEMTGTAVDLSLPKFEFTWGTKSFNEALQSLGMLEAFQSSADFSGMSDYPLFIDKVLHQAYIGVDEQGTEAAAATAVIMDAGASEDTEADPPVVFNVDRPFIIFIRDASGAILFAGQVVDPS